MSNEKKKHISLAQMYHPKVAAEVSRRQLLQSGVSLTGYMSMASLFGQRALAQSAFPVQRRLVWINMRGGWDILEITDPKPASTSGIDMTYDWGLAPQLSNGTDRVGRWLTRLASQQGDDMLVVRGLNMGTTSHMAGSVYMDTGILSNAGNVNSASIPAIVASESDATIPIIQLNGGSDPITDRGLLNPVSVVRAQNLELYRSMYPDTDETLNQKLLMLDHLNNSIAKAQAVQGENDRLTDLSNAQAKVRVQFENDVGAKLALTDEDRAPFTVDAPTTLNSGQSDPFALALKMLKNDLVSCVNLGIGGFDTHANQERSMQPIVERFDYLLSTFMTELRSAGQLDNTLIVVYSDFGRTPKVNTRNGRDHWPFGGALMLGGGINGGRAVGVTDDDLRAVNVNTTTGLEDSSGITLKPTHLGGSVLELTLGSSYLQYRSYLESIPALTQLKS
ncbi:DUF1501 domain-containing protein [Pseudobacteriovorax antillogorgiicola]|uniref:Tat (Twin-arginine translocation) pathway signal sequence n=1 Tax=Pseudobacteriovorax antillogorgiicola TaxID=1513793 RepID=A0A1Y6CI11_9BACT|nr:DUF1501 domain-containing protein [Pseudobacteriovorax antillogorgiicola]TCS48609.1 uncharacterized protein DUF1501 [Pseudobacteriovorax antillogorgiicola]SMF55510.1 Protein of unknown function [Pseudobacteriovorax antillogorgiicola]